MANIKNYIRFNSLTNIDSIKVSTVTSNTLEEAREEKDILDSDLVIQTDFHGETTVDANYFSPSGALGGKKMTVYRKTPAQKYYDFVCELNGTFYITDYNIANEEYYHYLIAVQMTFGEEPIYNIYQNKKSLVNSDGSITEYLDYIKVYWNEWSICNIEELADLDEETDKIIYKKKGNVWNFNLNINEENLSQNLSINTWDTLSRYPKISIGQKDYQSSSISCLLGRIKEYNQFNGQENIISNKYKTVYGYTEKYDTNNPYAREVEKLHRWEEFCADGELKLLKDSKGNKWIVQIVGVPSNNIDFKTNIQETMITFEWQEVVNIDEVSIIGDDSFKKKKIDYISSNIITN